MIHHVRLEIKVSLVILVRDTKFNNFTHNKAVFGRLYLETHKSWIDFRAIGWTTNKGRQSLIIEVVWVYTYYMRYDWIRKRGDYGPVCLSKCGSTHLVIPRVQVL